MNPPQDKSDKEKMEIATQIAELSRFLGMIPSDDTIQVTEPITRNEMVLSDWLSATRRSFFKLSLLIGKELDIQLS
jgi:hypothetical protein